MNENLLLVNDIGLNLIDYLNNIGIEPVCTCNSPVSKDRIEQWEAKNYPYQLPASLKDFLSVTDGFTLNYDRELHGEDISLGRIHINSLDDIVPLLVEREDISDIMIVLDAREITGTGTILRNPLNYSCKAAASLVNFFLRTRNRVGLITYGESVNVISPDTGERHLFKILTALAEIKSAGSLGLHTVLGDLRNFTPRSPVMVISTLENDKTSATALREITARGFKLTVIAPDTLDYDRDSRIISPTVYFTASASLENKITEARSLGARAMRWNPDSVLSTSLAEVIR